MDQISWSTHVLETYIFSSSFGEVISRLEQVVNKKSSLLGIYINAITNDFESTAEIENLFSLHSSDNSLMLDDAINPIILSEIWRNKIFYVSYDFKLGNAKVHDSYQETLQATRVTLNIPIGRSKTGQDVFAEFCFCAKTDEGEVSQVTMLAVDEIEFIQKFFLAIKMRGIDAPESLESLPSDDSQGTPVFKSKFQDGRYRLLDKRQLEIAELLNNGYTNQEIARALHVSVATVKLEVSRIIKNFGISSRKEIPD